MKQVLIISILLLPWILKGQTCFEKLKNNEFKVYLDGSGLITDSLNASFYRVASFDSTGFIFNGSIKDYYINDTIAFIGNYIDGLLSGDAKYYFPDGALMIHGSYFRGKRNGDWLYYYSNSQLQSKRRFAGNKMYIIDSYNKSGKQQVVHGEGVYKSNMRYGMSNSVDVKFNGKIVNGLPHGKWSIPFMYGNATEFFENGNFISGRNYDGKKYETSIIKFDINYVSEFINIMQSKFYLCNDKRIKIYSVSDDGIEKGNSMPNDILFFKNAGINLPKYNNHDLNFFLSKLLEELSKDIDAPFLSLVEFRIDKDGKVKNEKVISSRDEINSLITNKLYSMDDFEPAKSKNGNYETFYYFPLFYYNGVSAPKFQIEVETK